MTPRRVLVSLFRSAAFLLIPFLSGCGSGSSSTAPSSTTPSSTAPVTGQAYLAAVLTTMQTNSLYRNTIDWGSFKQAVTAVAPNPQSIADTYPAITKALDLLGDLHSNFQKPDGTYILNPGVIGRCTVYPPPTPSIPPDIGYVKVGTYLSTGWADDVAFAAGIQRTIAAADGPLVKGWIVDLRGNNGGNMYPMVAGVGPLLGEGLAGAFISPDGTVSANWTYANGASTSYGRVQVQVPDPYTISARPRVAVLTDCTVASSGEAVAISFRGRPGTRSFGGATFGVSTAPHTFPMSDGGRLNLSVEFMADRNLTKYGGPVVPDEVIDDPTRTVERAIEWLRFW